MILTGKLTAPDTISRSRDMIDAHQNLNGLRDLTMPLAPFLRYSEILVENRRC